MFRKGKTGITAKYLKTNLVICSHSRERKISSKSLINMVVWYNKANMCLICVDGIENGVTLIRLLLKEQSDLGLYCLLRSVCPNTLTVYG